jgi:hypothetical protein
VAAPVFREVTRWTLNHLRVTPRLKLAEVDGDGNQGEQATFVVMKGDTNVQEGQRLMGEGAGEPGSLSGVYEELLPDFRGEPMREVLKKGSELGIQVVLEGTGLAVEQSPEPGVGLSKVSQIRVKFNPPI